MYLPQPRAIFSSADTAVSRQAVRISGAATDRQTETARRFMVGS
jgi:hypothetical protein